MKSSPFYVALIPWAMYVVGYVVVINLKDSGSQYRFDLTCDVPVSSIIRSYAHDVAYTVNLTTMDGCAYHWFPEYGTVCDTYDVTGNCTHEMGRRLPEARYNHTWERWGAVYLVVWTAIIVFVLLHFCLGRCRGTRLVVDGARPARSCCHGPFLRTVILLATGTLLGLSTIGIVVLYSREHPFKRCHPSDLDPYIAHYEELQDGYLSAFTITQANVSDLRRELLDRCGGAFRLIQPMVFSDPTPMNLQVDLVVGSELRSKLNTVVIVISCLTGVALLVLIVARVLFERTCRRHNPCCRIPAPDSAPAPAPAPTPAPPSQQHRTPRISPRMRTCYLLMVPWALYVVGYAVVVNFKDLGPDPQYRFDLTCDVPPSTIIAQHATNVTYAIDLATMDTGCEYHWLGGGTTTLTHAWERWGISYMVIWTSLVLNFVLLTCPDFFTCGMEPRDPEDMSPPASPVPDTDPHRFVALSDPDPRPTMPPEEIERDRERSTSGRILRNAVILAYGLIICLSSLGIIILMSRDHPFKRCRPNEIVPYMDRFDEIQAGNLARLTITQSDLVALHSELRANCTGSYQLVRSPVYNDTTTVDLHVDLLVGSSLQSKLDHVVILVYSLYAGGVIMILLAGWMFCGDEGRSSGTGQRPNRDSVV